MTDALEVRVECYSGYRGDEEPRGFWLGERHVAVEAILDRWLGPDHRYFKLDGVDGGRYILRHDTNRDRWELTVYERRT